MELFIRSSPWMIGWLDILAFLSCLLHFFFLRFFVLDFFSDISMPQSSAIENDFDLTVELLSDLHFAPSHSGSRPIDQQFTAFPLDGIAVGDYAFFLEAEDIPVSDSKRKLAMQVSTLKRLSSKLLIVPWEIGVQERVGLFHG